VLFIVYVCTALLPLGVIKDNNNKQLISMKRRTANLNSD